METRDFGRMKRQALSALREVVELAERVGAESAARSMREDRVRRLEEERFHLVVLGEFNHGKSTFVNALLGASVLPVGVTPTTAVLHHIRHGEEGRAQVVANDGSRSLVSLEVLERFEVDGEADLEAIERVDVEHPAAFLAGGLVLVDTPGVNDLNDARAEITYGYIPRADAVIFLLDAGQILKESERSFIENKLLAGARDKLFFVINKTDLLSDEERVEALAYARTNIGKLVDAPRIFGMSAEQALEGDRAGSGLPPFVEALEGFLRDERGRLLVDNALDAGVRAADMLLRGIDIQRQALSMESGELDRRLKALEADLEASAERLAGRTQRLRESIAAVKAVVRQDVVAFGNRFAQALPDEIDASDADDLSKYLGDFIESRFRELADAQAKAIEARLSTIAEETIAFVAEDARARADRLEAALGEDTPRLDLDVSTFAYDVSVIAVGAFGVTIMVLSNVLVGAGMVVAMPILAYVFRGRTNRQIKEKALAEAPRVVHEAAARMADAFDERIDDFADKLVAFLAEANEEVTRSIAELVRSAQAAQRAGASSLAALEEDTSMSRVRLADVRSRMLQMRAALASG